MNDIFSLSRFGALMRKELAEHYKGYLMAMALLAGAIALWVGVSNALLEKPMETDMQYVIFCIFYLGTGILFTSSIFREIGEKKSTTAILMLPASHFEKFITKWIFSFVFFQLAFVALFYLVMAPMVNTGNFHGHKAILVDVFSRKDLKYIVFIYAIGHSVALWGAIFFRKLHFIKTGFVALTFLLVLATINHFLLTALIGKRMTSVELFGGVRFMDAGNMRYVQLNHGNLSQAALLGCTLILLFWLAAYYRLKEKQV